MPLTDLHKKRRVKNFAVLAALVVFMVILFAITIIRLSPDGAAG
jgi:hypothetical protein